MLLVRIVENNKIDAYFRVGKVKQRIALPRRVRKGIRTGPPGLEPPAGARNSKNTRKNNFQ